MEPRFEKQIETIAYTSQVVFNLYRMPSVDWIVDLAYSIGVVAVHVNIIIICADRIPSAFLVTREGSFMSNNQH